MKEPNNAVNAFQAEAITPEEDAAIRANIEKYLNNHTREDGHAYQHNMAARRETWHPLHVSQDTSVVDEHRADAP